MKLIKTTYGAGSRARLSTCHADLQRVANLALQYANLLGRDISIVEGHRPLVRQQELFESGKSQLKEGKHNLVPSKALDFMPYSGKYKALTGNPAQIREIARINKIHEELAERKVFTEFALIAACFFLAANVMEIPIRWGGDWDMDNDIFNNNFDDLGHIELL